jgi:hypothetical protein
MALITDQPEDIPTTDALADIPDDLLSTPAAYLGFGSTSYALPDPPSEGEKRTYVVRIECTGEHGPLRRTDGEVRYKRDCKILWAVQKGEVEPPDPEEEQPALFDEDGEASDEAADGETPDNVARPDFSDGAK